MYNCGKSPNNLSSYFKLVYGRIDILPNVASVMFFKENFGGFD